MRSDLERLRIPEEELDEEGDRRLFQGKTFTGVAYDNFPDGSPACEIDFQDGLPHGIWREWRAPGRLLFESHCLHGLKHGVTVEWKDDGRTVESVYEYGVALKRTERDRAGNTLKEESIDPGSPAFQLVLDARQRWGKR